MVLNFNPTKRSTSTTKKRPRWHTQTNIMFMALRSMPNCESSRKDLITKALQIDKKLHLERGLPLAFTGKTPRNSASACLTTNPHKYFVQFYKHEKIMFFKMAYLPMDLQGAIDNYNKWMHLLVTVDWPVCFSSKNNLDQDDNIPTSWEDILVVKQSTVPESGLGLFAIRNIPARTPIGFYFGVPLMEDEYDMYKDNVGLSSSYSIMYRHTVLDATDEHGLPFTDPKGIIYCPFHFANENVPKTNLAFLEGSVINQVICTTIKNIKEGDELFVYYGDEVDRSKWGNIKKLDQF